MVVHLSRPAVGIESLDHFYEVIEMRTKGGQLDTTQAYTRNMPKRADELVDGGSIYWIIKGQYCARQKILKLEKQEDDEGRKFCIITLDAELIRTVPQLRRAHQGWRYLNEADAPDDLPEGDAGDLTPEMAAELKELGLL